MSAHTPGPWRFDEQNSKSSSYYIRGTLPNGRPMTFGMGAVAHIPRSTMLPMAANARLIAAAPELLEVVQQLLLAYSNVGTASMRQDARFNARAAIAKATGSAA